VRFFGTVTIFVCLALAAAVITAHAREISYTCHAPDEIKERSAKVDLTKKTIKWNGNVYRNLKPLSECDAKACFEASNRNGRANLTLLYGTYASLVMFGASNGVDEFDCELVTN
jgi:hypothetical protein